MTEVTYLLRKLIGYQSVPPFIDRLVGTEFELQTLTHADLRRVREIMAQYADSELDFVDCCPMALS